MSFEFDVDDFLRGLDMSDKKVQKAAHKGMEDVTDDLARTASETAPHKKGTLEKSYDKDVKWTSNKTIVGEVTFSIKERGKSGDFNYALWTHESNYKLGKDSLSKPGGMGMSRQRYPVGNKYLERPLKGESDAYKKHIAETIRKELS